REFVLRCSLPGESAIDAFPNGIIPRWALARIRLICPGIRVTYILINKERCVIECTVVTACHMKPQLVTLERTAQGGIEVRVALQGIGCTQPAALQILGEVGALHRAVGKRTVERS